MQLIVKINIALLIVLNACYLIASKTFLEVNESTTLLFYAAVIALIFLVPSLFISIYIDFKASEKNSSLEIK